MAKEKKATNEAEAAAELDLRASVEVKAMSKLIVGLKATAEDQDCFEAEG
jgi:hypothetical protein